MKLYRIRRKSDGKFFAGLNAPWLKRYWNRERWYDKGVFYQNIDTATKWVEVLCGRWYRDGCGRYTAEKMKVTHLDRKKLKLYEIVVNDVALNKEKILQPKDLIK